MKLSKSVQFLSDGRVSAAVMRDGRLIFFIDTGAAIIKKSQEINRKTLSEPEIVSYAEEYAETQNSAISLNGNELEVKRL